MTIAVDLGRKATKQTKPIANFLTNIAILFIITNLAKGCALFFFIQQIDYGCLIHNKLRIYFNSEVFHVG